MNFAHCPLSSNKRTTKEGSQMRWGRRERDFHSRLLCQHHCTRYICICLHWITNQPKWDPKQIFYIVCCYLIEKQNVFFFFAVKNTVRMKLLSSKSWSQTHSPTCNKKPTAQKGDGFYVLLLLSVSPSEVLLLCLNYDHGGVFSRLSF